MILARPWLLLLLLLLPVGAWLLARRRRRSNIAYSTAALAASIPPSLAVRLRWIGPGLRVLAFILLVIALAGPRKTDERTRIRAEGIAIQLVLDRSGSMLALDFQIDGEQTDRLSAVKTVVEDFVAGTGDLAGRPDDLVGLITFASFADSVCPLTLDQEHLVDVVRSTRVASEAEGRGTAIGDAIALAVERLEGIARRRDIAAPGEKDNSTGGHVVRSRIMILLTDGENTDGEIDPLTAAELAASFGVRIYTIGAGSASGFAEVPVRDPFTGREHLQRVPVSIDEETLRAIADTTGGAYFRATDTESLRSIYATIDELEKTEIEQQRFTRYDEMAVESVRLGRWTLPPVLLAAFACLALEMALGATRLGRG